MENSQDISSWYANDAFRLYSRDNLRYRGIAHRRRLPKAADSALRFIATSVSGGLLFDAIKALVGL